MKNAEIENKKELNEEGAKIHINNQTEKIKELELNLQRSEKSLAQAQAKLSNWNAEHDETVIELAEAQAFIQQMQKALHEKGTELNLERNRIIEVEG